MYEEKEITFIHQDDSNGSTTQAGTHLLANLSGSQPSYRAEKYEPAISEGMVVKSDLRINSSVDDIYSSLPFDTSIQPAVHDVEALCFPDIYPHDSRHNPQSLQYDMMTWADAMGEYELNATLTANDFSHVDTPKLIPMSPIVRGYPLEDVMGSFLSSQSYQNLSIQSQGTPSPRLESSARPLRGVPVRRKAYMGGPSRYHYTPTRQHHSPPFQPYASSGGHSDVMFSTSLPYSSPDTLVNQKRRLQHSSQRYIQRRHQYGNRALLKLDPSLAYNAWLYPHPESAHIKEQNTKSFFSAFADRQNADSLHDRQVTLESQDWRLQDLVPPPLATPGDQTGVVASPLLLCPSDTMVEPWLSQPSAAGHLPAHYLRGEVPPETTPTSGEITIASSLTFSNERHNSPLHPSTTCDGNMQSFNAAIPSWMHMDPSSRQYPDQALSPVTIAICQSDVAVSATSTPSFPGASTWGSVYSADWIDLDPKPNDTCIPPVSPQSRLSDQLLPSHTPPEIGQAPATASYCTDDPSTVPFPALANEHRDKSPSIRPAALNPRERLQGVLGPSSPLTNEALLRLLLLVIESSFIWTHEMEPIITSDEGQALLRQIQSIPDCPPNVFQMSKCSIFTLFVVAHFRFHCLICGSSKQSMARGIGCVRSHLNHRPYPCRNEGACDACPKDRIVKRFFTASLLRDHCNRPERETECTSCGAILTSSMKRHWGAKHPDTPFPYEDYPNYRTE